MNTQSENVSIINEVMEKAELMTAVGREIQRIDQVSTSNGYTSWALWGALGLISWKALDLLTNSSLAEVGQVYLISMLVLANLRLCSKMFPFEDSGQGETIYFRAPTLGRSGALRMLLLWSISVICTAIYLSTKTAENWWSWIPVVYLSLPTLIMLTFKFISKIPIPESNSYKIQGNRSAFFASIFILTAGVFSTWLVGHVLSVDFSKPSDGFKVGLLSAAATVLALRLTQNIRTEERRANFQRLETDMTLSKIDVAEASERYENLMLGMSVSVAIRPWVEAVMTPLDEANSSLSELKQLLVHYSDSKRLSGAGDGAHLLDDAVKDRVATLLNTVEASVGRSSKALIKFKAISDAMFGKGREASDPLASELDRILNAQNKVRETADEVRSIRQACGLAD